MTLTTLQKGKIIANQKTKKLYNNPPNHYTASLFGEVSKVPIKLLKSYSQIDKSVLVYPHEFKLSKSSGMKVELSNSFFKGSHYLNLGKAEDGTPLYFNTTKKQKIGGTIFLNVSLKTINRRLQGEQAAST